MPEVLIIVGSIALLGAIVTGKIKGAGWEIEVARSRSVRISLGAFGALAIAASILIAFTQTTGGPAVERNSQPEVASSQPPSFEPGEANRAAAAGAEELSGDRTSQSKPQSGPDVSVAPSRAEASRPADGSAPRSRDPARTLPATGNVSIATASGNSSAAFSNSPVNGNVTIGERQ
jgi:hypothetical protein